MGKIKKLIGLALIGGLSYYIYSHKTDIWDNIKNIGHKQEIQTQTIREEYIPPENDTITETEQEIHMVYVNHLKVNNYTSYRTAVQKTEEKGIVDIRNLIITSPLEEAWAFIPQENLWIEVGEYSGIDEEGQAYVKWDNDKLYQLMQEHNELVLYHFHPTSSAGKDMKSSQRENTNLENTTANTPLNLIYRTLPSKSDFFFMIPKSKYFYEINPDGKISNKVCSFNGIVEFDLTDEGRYIEKKDLQNIVLGMLLERRIIIKSLDINKNLSRICEGMTNDYIYTNFTPYNSD